MRSLVLGAFAFVATLILLFGLVNLVRTADPREASLASPTANPTLATTRPTGSTGSIESASPSTGSASASASGDPTLVGAGDIADCGLEGDAVTATLLDTIPGTVFTAGDNASPDGSADQFRDCYGPTWGRHLTRTRPAAGNEDWLTKDLAGYLGYFGVAAGSNGRSWYSYDLGAWHIVVLDSDCSSVAGCGPDSAQGHWLADDLQGSAARCTLAIWHRPRFSSGEQGNDTAVAPFWRALHDAGAEVVISGHDRDYERFAPQDPDGRADPERGLREFVVGTGGAALRTFPTTAANSELRAAIVHGVIRFVLHPTSYEWTFVPTSGDFGDSGSGTCH